MNETSGTTLANSGSGGSNYNMTTVNTPTLNQAGVPFTGRGPSVLFTAASSQYAEVNKNDTGTGPTDLGSDKTFFCWNKFTDVSTRYTVMGAGPTNAPGGVDNYSWLLTLSTTDKFSVAVGNNSNGSYMVATGGTNVSVDTWYMFAWVWTQATPKVELFLNGVSDGSTTTTSGTINTGVQYIAIGKRYQALPVYMQGYIQDCTAVGSALSGANLLTIYTAGTTNASGNGLWPFMVKAPSLPRFRDDNYWDVAKRDGWLTGQFMPRALKPQYLLTGYYPIFPNGNTRRFR